MLDLLPLGCDLELFHELLVQHHPKTRSVRDNHITISDAHLGLSGFVVGVDWLFKPAQIAVRYFVRETLRLAHTASDMGIDHRRSGPAAATRRVKATVDPYDRGCKGA